MDDAAPDAYWITGYGFNSAFQWHTDFASIGMSSEDIRQMAYMKSSGDGIYRASVYLSGRHGWGWFRMQICENREKLNPVQNPKLTGTYAGISVSGVNKTEIVGGTPFAAGYYLITYNKSDNSVHFERLN